MHFSYFWEWGLRILSEYATCHFLFHVAGVPSVFDFCVTMSSPGTAAGRLMFWFQPVSVWLSMTAMICTLLLSSSPPMTIVSCFVCTSSWLMVSTSSSEILNMEHMLSGTGSFLNEYIYIRKTQCQWIDNNSLKCYLCVHEFLEIVKHISGHNKIYRNHTQCK